MGVTDVLAGKGRNNSVTIPHISFSHTQYCSEHTL